MNDLERHPRVGVGVLVRRDGRILLGKRRGSHGEGAWAAPGGHLEFGEEIEACVRREILEETDLTVTNIHFAAITNDIFIGESRHYVTIMMVCDYAAGDLKNLEPDKCEEWRWFGWDALPAPIFLPLQNLRKQGFTPFPSPSSLPL